MTVGRKYPSIDLFALYSKGDTAAWNQILTRCLVNHDVESLKKMLYGVEAGMTDLANENLNTEKMCEFFLRLQGSIEKTAKRIFREKYPNPKDNPAEAGKWDITWLTAKRKRDHEFELFLKGARF